MMTDNPAASENNRHHEGGYRSQRDWDDENLSRGSGDPDFQPLYPGQPDYELTDKERKALEDKEPF